MTLEIISVGDELLIGQVVNTNASFIGELCSSVGVHVARITTIGDDKQALLEAFERAWAAHDFVIVTGGLGPTHDDITREAVVAFFLTELEFSETVFADIQEFFAQRKRDIAEINRDQAMVPKAAAYIRNANGTAPGMHFERDGKHFFVLPGVPIEMKAMMREYIKPLLAQAGPNTRATSVLMSTGIPESELAAKLKDIERFFNVASLAYLPSALGVRMRITSQAASLEEAEATLREIKEFIYDRAGEFIFGEKEIRLEEVIGSMLKEQGMTVAVAESCTGGLLADKITDVPGSSEYFLQGYVTYSNESKEALLGVPKQLMIDNGAVSQEVAVAMAEGARKYSGSTYALSTTGIAGPGGGTDEKPVGLVWIGFSSAETSFAHPYYFGNDRKRNKTRAAQAALDILRRHILGLPIHTPSARSAS